MISIIKIKELVLQNKAYFFRYFLVGISGVTLDMSTLYSLKNFFGLNPVIAVMLNQAVMIVYIFFLNKFYSFKNTDPIKGQMARFLLLCGFNYAFAASWMWIFSEKIGLNYLLVRIANIALSTLWNFVLYKTYVYRAKKSSVPEL